MDVKMYVKEKDVKFKDIVILRRASRKKQVADAANKNMKLVDELVDFIEENLKSFKDFFSENKDVLQVMEKYFKTKPKIENKTGQREIYKLTQVFPVITSGTGCEKAFNQRFKKDKERMEEINKNYRKNTKMVIGNFATSGHFSEKTIIQAMKDTEKEIIERKQEFVEITASMFKTINCMLRAAYEVKKIVD